MKKEKIEVVHDTGDKNNTDVNSKSLLFEFNGYSIRVSIAGEGHYTDGVDIEMINDKCDEGLQIRTKIKNAKIALSLDANGGIAETEERNYSEWLKLERVERAIKLIGSIIKK